MTSIVIAPPCSPMIATTLTSTDPHSGNLAVEVSSNEFFPTAIDKYKERFAKIQAELEEKERKLEKEQRKLQQDLRRAHVYTKILADLHEVWWPRLPKRVRQAFRYAGKIDSDLPSSIAIWWLQWEEVSSSEFPLPLSLRHFGPVTLRTRACFIFDYWTGEESEFSKAALEAWYFLPDTVRQLMLFAWAGIQSVRVMLHNVADIDVDKSTAQEILRRDFRNTFKNLHVGACYMADYLFHD